MEFLAYKYYSVEGNALPLQKHTRLTTYFHYLPYLTLIKSLTFSSFTNHQKIKNDKTIPLLNRCKYSHRFCIYKIF